MHCPALPVRPETELMLMMQPSFARRNSPVQWRIILNAPFRLVLSTASKASSFIMAMRPSRVIPALFTRMWAVPKSALMAATVSFVSSKEATSQR